MTSSLSPSTAVFSTIHTTSIPLQGLFLQELATVSSQFINLFLLETTTVKSTVASSSMITSIVPTSSFTTNSVEIGLFTVDFLYFYKFSVVVNTSSTFFVTPRCSDRNTIGTNCNTSALPCDMLRPCRNNASCINTNITADSYICTCLSGFIGLHCEIDNRPCQSDTCWNNGIVSPFASSPSI